MENGEMRMLSDELRVVRIWHSGLERVGRTAVSDWKGLDAQQLWMGKGGRTAVMDGKEWTHSSASLQLHSFTISLITIY
jgi:hypothetical protein